MNFLPFSCRREVMSRCLASRKCKLCPLYLDIGRRQMPWSNCESTRRVKVNSYLVKEAELSHLVSCCGWEKENFLPVQKHNIYRCPKFCIWLFPLVEICWAAVLQNGVPLHPPSLIGRLRAMVLGLLYCRLLVRHHRWWHRQPLW